MSATPSTCSARSQIPTGSYFKHRRICSIPPRLFQTGATCCKPRIPSPRPIFGTSTRAAPIGRWPPSCAGATTRIAVLSWHMRGPMPRPHLRMLWTRLRPLLRILKRRTASPARLLHKLRWLPRSLGRAYSSRFLTFALTRQPPRRRMPTTQKWRGGRPIRGGWPIVPLLKRSGPRNRQP